MIEIDRMCRTNGGDKEYGENHSKHLNELNIFEHVDVDERILKSVLGT
jgi:hypothetical protein